MDLGSRIGKSMLSHALDQRTRKAGGAFGFNLDFGGGGSRAEAASRADDYKGALQADKPKVLKRPHRELAIALGFAGIFVAAWLGISSAGGETQSYTHPFVKDLLAAVGAVLAVGAFFLWRRAWDIADTPTMEAAGLRPGVFEVEGTILPNGPAHLSWFTETECAWWEAKVERLEKSGDNKKWRTKWSRRGGSKKFWLEDQSGHVRIDMREAKRNADRQLVEERYGDYRLTETAYVVGESLWAKGQVVADDHGLVMGGPHVQHKVMAAVCEEKYVRNTRLWAFVLSVVSAFLMATYTLWGTGISTHPEHMGKETLIIREGALLRPFIAIVAIAAIFWTVSFFFRLYNRLVGLRNQSSAAWSGIEVTAVQRHDVIEGLVAATKGAAAHERDLLARIAAREAELAAADADLPDSAHVREVDQGLSADGQARTLIARAEAMPELKTSANFSQLFHTLVRIENRMAASRKYYNDAVMLLDDRSSEFPGNLVAWMVVPDGAPPPLQFDPEVQVAPAVGAQLATNVP